MHVQVLLQFLHNKAVISKLSASLLTMLQLSLPWLTTGTEQMRPGITHNNEPSAAAQFLFLASTD